MLNQIIIQGKFTKDVEISVSGNGKKYAIFCIAVQRNYKNQSGKYDADFIDCIASEKVAEHIAKYFKKGSEIILSGELQTRVYDDANGQKRKSVLVNVGKTYFTSGKSENTTQETSQVEGTEESGELPFEQ